MKKEKVLVTGSAGFIGFHLTLRLINEGYSVVGLDNINSYYDVNLKLGRLAKKGISLLPPISIGLVHSDFPTLGSTPPVSSLYPDYRFIRMQLEDKQGILELFATEKFDFVIHLAAQAGVRYSLENPQTYIDSNISGTLNILEACRAYPVKHLVYASSSSVYGLNTLMPFSVHHNVDHPVSLYAASKKANELMAHTYSHLFQIPTTGLRFFTVYGPWGRPDMALFLFTKAILSGQPIDVYNNGNMLRDFTYIDDIVEGIFRVALQPPLNNPLWDKSKPDPGASSCPYKLYNIGNSSPVKLLHFIEALEESLGIKANIHFMPMQPGDVQATWADCSDLEKDTGYKPSTPVGEGIKRFVDWYRAYYNV